MKTKKILYILFLTLFLTACSKEEVLTHNVLPKHTMEIENTTPPTANPPIPETAAPKEDIEISNKELMIEYKGTPFMKSVFAAGSSIYVCGKDMQENYFLSSMNVESDSFLTTTYVDAPMRIFNMLVDDDGLCHALLYCTEKMEFNGTIFDSINFEKSIIQITDGETIIKEIDISDIMKAEKHRPYCFAIDENGNYYLENADKITVISPEGTVKNSVLCDGNIEGIGCGNSGSIYCVYLNENEIPSLGKIENAEFIPCNVELDDVGALYSTLQKGANTELLLFNKAGGIYTYDALKNEVTLAKSISEFPVVGEDISGCSFLSDQRLCIITNNTENTYIYYVTWSQ